MTQAPRDADGFSDSDQDWFERLRSGSAEPPATAAQREADLLRQALERQSARAAADERIAAAAGDEARELQWQRLQFRLRQQEAEAERARKRWWQRPATWAPALAASLLVAVVVVQQLPGDETIYDEPPTMRGEFELHRVADSAPRAAAEALAAQLKAAGQPAVLHQQGKVFSVDVPLAADAPAEALAILRRTGARGLVGSTTRVEFAPKP